MDEENGGYKFEPGERVRFIDSEGEATVIRIVSERRYEVETDDGLRMILDCSELIPVNPAFDAKLKDARPKSKRVNSGVRLKDYKRNNGEREVVDLHLKLPKGSNALEIQLQSVKNTMDANIHRRGKQIVFIHGVGNGVLKQGIENLIRSDYPHCYCCEARYDIYGVKGALMVEILD